MNIWLSRFLYAPHNLSELIGAAFGWMLMAAVPAMLWILIEFWFTPNYRRLDKTFRYTKVFEVCTVYMVLLTLVFVVYCVVPMYVPAMHRFLELKNYQ